MLNATEFETFVDDILNEMTGLGPIEPLLKDDTVNDILINTHKQIYVERRGVLELSDARFKDEAHLLRIINKIVSTVGRRVDESQPMCDARLLDGSRVNVAIKPVAVDGPLVSIRKFSKRPYSMEKLVENNALSREMAAVLAAAVKGRVTVLVSGGTGSGKTTMLNALSSYISPKERLITIEDAAELQLQQPHVGRMETRPPNIEGKGEIRQRELVKNALRMRPDRIVVGECRGEEAFDMLQAMNTGHEGSMTTIHANTTRDALGRLETMIGMAGLPDDHPEPAHPDRLRHPLVVQLQRMSDGKRKVDHGQRSDRHRGRRDPDAGDLPLQPDPARSKTARFRAISRPPAFAPSSWPIWQAAASPCRPSISTPRRCSDMDPGFLIRMTFYVCSALAVIFLAEALYLGVIAPMRSRRAINRRLARPARRLGRRAGHAPPQGRARHRRPRPDGDRWHCARCWCSRACRSPWRAS